MKILNPVIRGFYPDPSVCKANGKYYLACSSFQYFPGVPIFESEDLVNWKQVGHCLNRIEQVVLHQVPSSGGVFAPTLRYHNGIYYMVTNNNTYGKNFYVYTKDIYGEWSKPIFVDQEGIDPSLLFDGEKVYFTTNGNDELGRQCILQCEIEIQTGRKLTDSIPIWSGSGGKYLESPHLYHINEWYYLMVAEGGTEYGHMITYARSKNPFGPFESYEKNPVLSNRDIGGNRNPIQGIGHGDLIQDERGRYFILCLGFRQCGEWQPFHHLGREVFLAPVYWMENGWFRAGDNGTVTEWMEMDIEAKIQEICHDFSFEKNDLSDLRWCYLRDYKKENYTFSNQILELKGTEITLEDADTPTFVGIRQSEFYITFSVAVDGGAAEAGVTCYMDECQHYDLYIANRKEGRFAELRLKVGEVQNIVKEIPVQGEVCLQVESEPEWYSFYIIEESEKHFMGKARCKYLSSEVAGGFTGVIMALYAVDETGKTAYFSKFYLRQHSKLI